MIDRYSHPEMKALFDLKSQYTHWLEVELAVCDALAEIDEIPKEAAQFIRRNANINVDRALEIEFKEGMRHDVNAFCKMICEQLGDYAQYFHRGITSFDLGDTANALRLRQACDIILADCQQLEAVLIGRAQENKYTPMIGRTHGVHAEPITFGFKLAGWVDMLPIEIHRMERAREAVSVGMINGAVGSYANIDPRVQEIVCRNLGLRSANVTTQVLPRNIHAEYISALAILASVLEHFATEIRNLQRTDILEVEEPFPDTARGSSAMPHKRNPERCETICGLSRVVRAKVIPILESVTTWHERDITNSSVERLEIADASILVDYMLRRFIAVMEGLNVYPENMNRNLARTQGVIHSQQVMLALMVKGWTRDDAYELTKQLSMQAWHEQRPFRELLEQDPTVAETLSADELDTCFDIAPHLRHIDYIFQRVGI